jgi:hypothetical protein
MRILRVVATAAVVTLAGGPLGAQQMVAPASAGQKSLAATMNVYVFPSKGQTPEQQNTDEATCYDWAEQNTGTDPFKLQQQSQAQKQQAQQDAAAASMAGTGAGAVGAVRGAAAGTLIGAIAGDTGAGALYGAAAGLLIGHRRHRMAEEQAEAQVQQSSAQAQQATAEELANFKKAFSVCLEAKDYMVKY